MFRREAVLRQLTLVSRLQLPCIALDFLSSVEEENHGLAICYCLCIGRIVECVISSRLGSWTCPDFSTFQHRHSGSLVTFTPHPGPRRVLDVTVTVQAR